MGRVTTTLRQWCRVCQRITENRLCPDLCGRVVCAVCGDHGGMPCDRETDDE